MNLQATAVTRRGARQSRQQQMRPHPTAHRALRYEKDVPVRLSRRSSNEVMRRRTGAMPDSESTYCSASRAKKTLQNVPCVDTIDYGNSLHMCILCHSVHVQCFIGAMRWLRRAQRRANNVQHVSSMHVHRIKAHVLNGILKCRMGHARRRRKSRAAGAAGEARGTLHAMWMRRILPPELPHLSPREVCGGANIASSREASEDRKNKVRPER